jgi:putative restriction endonuclease
MNSPDGYSSVDALPPSPFQWNILEQTRVEKAASDAGFDISLTREGSWLVFRSSAFSQRLGVEQQTVNCYRVGFSDLTWGKAVSEDCSLLVVQKEGLWPTVAINLTGYDFLHHVLLRATSLCRVLAKEVLYQFQAATGDLPASTEAERLVIQRVGQDIFRRGLIEYWQGRCAVTQLNVVPLLRASHIRPWAACDTDAQRLDVFNGLLLAPQVDALFDGGWISFSDEGKLLVSESLPTAAHEPVGLRLGWALSAITDFHGEYLAYHRVNVFKRR